MECKIRDTTVHYEELGEGRPLFVLHGQPSDHRQMLADLEPHFSPRTGWRRIYPDLPGMGRTEAPEWIKSQDDVLDLVLALIDDLAPDEPFALAGFSYGGYLARGVVYQRPAQVVGLLLTAPVVEPDREKRDLPPRRVIREDAAFQAALQPGEELLEDVAVVQGMEQLQYFRRVIAPAFAMADFEFLERLRKRNAFSFDVDRPEQPFPAPVLIVTGRFDSWVGYRQAFDLLPNYPRGTYAVLDRAGHSIANEQKGLIGALVNEWLDRVEEYLALD